MKWFYRLGFLLLLFIVIFIFSKLQAVWMPLIKVFMALFIPFFIAGFITYLMHPVIERLHLSGMHRGVAVLIIYFFFFGGLGLAIYKTLPALIHQLRDLTENAPKYSDQYREWIGTMQSQTSRWPAGVQERLEEGIDTLELALDELLTRVITVLLGFLNFILVIAIIPFISFYMLKDFNLLKKTAWYLTPRQWRERGIRFLRDVDKSLGSYIRGQLTVCLIIGILASLFFWMAGMRYSLILGTIVGITNVIPYFGPLIGAIPAVIIAATISVKMIIISLVIVFSLQFLEGNILSPLIVGKSLHMHPLIIMLALLAGGEIAGILGLILAVPVLAVVKVAFIHGRDHLIQFNQERAKLR